MTPSHWREIERIYNAALDRPSAERPAFLSTACAGNQQLLAQVESLLAQSSKAGILEQPAWEGMATPSFADATITAVSVGAQLGPYKIEGPLGAGGMGEVFRAVDTRLGRPVAIKISKAKFSDRFEREERAISALNHPHICTLYDVGPNYLVMELVEGETLSSRLKRGKMSQQETLRYGAQIADALAEAHAKGITHRDLKPANIMLAKSGVKVLDFGLAKSHQDENMTAPNAVMGTPAYMAPEQREGKKCDARTDIYALGLILLEMATGRRAAAGESPNLDGLPETSAATLRRCLEPEPADRWHAAADVRWQLGRLASHPNQPSAAAPLPRRFLLWAALGLVTLGIVAGLFGLRTWFVATPAATVRLGLTPPQGAEIFAGRGFAISPDGRLLAFVAGSPAVASLWLRSFDSETPRELPGTEGAFSPFWSPDSRSVGFFAGGKLQRIETSGGPPAVICDVGSGRGGTWNEAGIILFNSVNDGPIFRVPAAGGKPVQVTTIDQTAHENSHRYPQFLPGGRRFLYFVRAETSSGEAGSGVYLGSLDDPHEKRLLLHTPRQAFYAAEPGASTGNLFWSNGETLYAQPFDPGSARLTAQPVTVAPAVASNAGGREVYAAVRGGTIVYAAATSSRAQLGWYNRQGRPLGSLGPPGTYLAPRLSPDGNRVAFIRDGVLWQMETHRPVPSSYPASTGIPSQPVWAPDSATVAYTKGSPPNLYAYDIAGGRGEKRAFETHDSLETEDWSPDGRYILYTVSSANDLSPQGSPNSWLFPIAPGGSPVPFRDARFPARRIQISPDGKWIAFTSTESGQNDIYVESFRAGGTRQRVSPKGGDYPRWRRDTRELFYVAADRRLMSVPIKVTDTGMHPGIPEVLFPLPAVRTVTAVWYIYDVTADGQSFLIPALLDENARQPVTVILNWRPDAPR